MEKRVTFNKYLIKNESTYAFTVAIKGKNVDTKVYTVNNGKTVYIKELDNFREENINKYQEIAFKNSNNKQKLHFSVKTSDLADSVGVTNPNNFFRANNFKYSFTNKSEKSCPRYLEIIIKDNFFE